MKVSIPPYNILPVYRAFDLRCDVFLEEKFYIGSSGDSESTYRDYTHFIGDVPICMGDKIVFERAIGVKDHTLWENVSQKEQDDYLNIGHIKDHWYGHELFIGDIVEYRGFYTNEYGERIKTIFTIEIKEDIPSLFNVQSICELNDTLVRIGNIHTMTDFPQRRLNE